MLGHITKRGSIQGKDLQKALQKALDYYDSSFTIWADKHSNTDPQGMEKAYHNWTKQSHAAADQLVRQNNPLTGWFKNMISSCKRKFASYRRSKDNRRIHHEEEHGHEEAKARVMTQTMKNNITNIIDDLSENRATYEHYTNISDFGMGANQEIRLYDGPGEDAMVIISAQLDDEIMSKFKQLAKRIASLDDNKPGVIKMKKDIANVFPVSTKERREIEAIIEMNRNRVMTQTH